MQPIQYVTAKLLHIPYPNARGIRKCRFSQRGLPQRVKGAAPANELLFPFFPLPIAPATRRITRSPEEWERRGP
jgi:hypothetical protein